MNQRINTDSKNSKEPQQKYRLGTVSIKKSFEVYDTDSPVGEVTSGCKRIVKLNKTTVSEYLFFKQVNINLSCVCAVFVECKTNAHILKYMK